MPAPPWFSFYPGDWIKSVSSLPLDVQGAYLRLLCHQWEHSSVPANDIESLICIIAGGCTRQRAKEIWSRLSVKFKPHGSATAKNERLEEIRVKVERFFSEQKRKSDLAAEARRGKPAATRGTNPRDIPDGSPILESQSESEDLRTGIEPRASNSPPQKPGSAGHSRALALVQPRDKSAFWEGPIFNIPLKWAAKALKGANGSLSEPSLSAFCIALHDKVERESIDVTAVQPHFLAWLDDELRQWRDGVNSEASTNRVLAESEARRRSLLEPVQ